MWNILFSFSEEVRSNCPSEIATNCNLLLSPNWFPFPINVVVGRCIFWVKFLRVLWRKSRVENGYSSGTDLKDIATWPTGRSCCDKLSFCQNVYTISVHCQHNYYLSYSINEGLHLRIIVKLQPLVMMHDDLVKLL